MPLSPALPSGLEDEYREALYDWAKRRGQTLEALLDDLRAESPEGKLSAADLRAAVVAELRESVPAHTFKASEGDGAEFSPALKQALDVVKGMKKAD